VGSELLQVRDLVVSFAREQREVRAVDGVSLGVPEGKTVGLVGESGSGKSITSLAIMGLLPRSARRESGSIKLGAQELTSLRERELRSVRGRRIGMIFQEPMTSLNPVFRIGDQIIEAVRAHRKLPKAEARARAVELLGRVGIAAPEERMGAYPHELSGGMRQRVMIAIALACDPELLIADEPTTALDVTIQAQILDLLSALSRDSGMGILLITHDLGVVAEHTHELFVMYAGKIVEHGKTRALFERPYHPYTRGLLESVPSYGDNLHKKRLPTIPGLVPDLAHLPSGCRFRERCSFAIARCAEQEPPLIEVTPGRTAACIRARELMEEA
jgi:oligopeptide/dipeptide ABC transporter ATP-binding protein